MKRVEYDPEGLVIRIGGPNVEMSQHVKVSAATTAGRHCAAGYCRVLLLQMGAFHTIELEMNRPFELHKQQWDSIYLERIETACNPERTVYRPCCLAAAPH